MHVLQNLKKYFSTKKEFKPVYIGTERMDRGELQVDSLTWVFMIQWIKDELKTLREKNDSISLDPAQTAEIRGRIKMLKRIAGLPEELAKKTAQREFITSNF